MNDLGEWQNRGEKKGEEMLRLFIVWEMGLWRSERSRVEDRGRQRLRPFERGPGLAIKGSDFMSILKRNMRSPKLEGWGKKNSTLWFPGNRMGKGRRSDSTLAAGEAIGGGRETEDRWEVGAGGRQVWLGKENKQTS